MKLLESMYVVVDRDGDFATLNDFHGSSEAAQAWAHDLDEDSPGLAPHRVLHITRPMAVDTMEAIHVPC